MDDFPLPKAVRFGLYVLGVLVGILASWGSGKGVLDDSDTAALFALSALLNGLAAVNSIPRRRHDEDEAH